MHACVGGPVGHDSNYCLEHVGKEKIEIQISNVTVVGIEFFITFF